MIDYCEQIALITLLSKVTFAIYEFFPRQVKPAGPYLHVVCKVKERHSALPMFIYHGKIVTDVRNRSDWYFYIGHPRR